jgi:hypothetical protein
MIVSRREKRAGLTDSTFVFPAGLVYLIRRIVGNPIRAASVFAIKYWHTLIDTFNRPRMFTQRKDWPPMDLLCARCGLPFLTSPEAIFFEVGKAVPQFHEAGICRSGAEL